MTYKDLKKIIILALLIWLTGCATTDNQQLIPDPLEDVNRAVYKFNDGLDTYVAKPIAQVYDFTPDPLQNMIRNFFNNIDDVMTVVNDILQFKLEQSFMDSMRIVTNTSFGAAGLFDVATAWEMPRHNERFADTLGYWGVESGPYIVIPFWGPSSLRDAPALVVDIYTYPLGYIYPVNVRNSLQGLKMVNNRANLLGTSELIKDVSVDEYSFVRDSYHQWRQNQIYDGNPPLEIPQGFDPDDL